MAKVELRVHFKTPVRESEAKEHRAEMKGTKVGYRYLHAHTESIAPGFEMHSTATVKSIELAAFMEQAGSDYVLAGRVLHAGSIVLTHAVASEAQTALTLREVCGLTTEDIARAFLVSPPTLAQRIVRAKAKIRNARIPYRMPPTEELPHRLEDVLRVAYLVFNEGYYASASDSLTRPDLSAEAIRLGRLLVALLPEA